MKSSRLGPVRMPRDQHALPRRQRRVEIRARPTRCAGCSASISRSRASVRGSMRAAPRSPSAGRAIGSSNSSVSGGMSGSAIEALDHRSSHRSGAARSARLRRPAPATAGRESATTRRRARAAGCRARRQFDLERHAPVAAVAREHLAERLEHRRGPPASSRESPLRAPAARARCRAAAISVARIRDRLVVALELAAHQHHACRSRSAPPRAEGLREHDTSTPPCASSSVNTAIRSPFFVFSWRQAATMPPMLVSASIGLRPPGPHASAARR